MREQWTDARLDDLNQRVSDGFNRVDADIRGLRSEMNARFDRVDNQMYARFDRVDSQMNARFDHVDSRVDRVESHFDRVDSRFDRIDARFDALQRAILQVGGGMVAALLAGVVALLAG